MNLLTALDAGIAEHPETALRIGLAALFKRQLRNQGHHPSDPFGVSRFDLGQGRNMLFWNEEKVDRRPRVDVVKGKELLVLKNLARRDLSGNDPAEDAVRIGRHVAACEEVKGAGLPSTSMMSA